MARTPRVTPPAPTSIAPSVQAKSGGRRGPRKGLPGGIGNRTHKTAVDSQADLARKQRRDRVIELVVQGVTKTRIAAELGVDEKTVRNDLNYHLHEHPGPKLDEVRETSDKRLESGHQRLDYLSRVLLQRMTELQPDGKTPVLSALEMAECTRAIARNVQVQTTINQSLRKLHGADAPEQVAVSGNVTAQVMVATLSIEDVLAAAAANARKTGGTLLVEAERVPGPAVEAEHQTVQ